MRTMWKSVVRALADRAGVRVLGKKHYLFLDHDMEPEFKASYRRCQPYTMTSIERLYALYSATRYVTVHQIPGALVECGVWRGGSAMLAAETLVAVGDTARLLYLYDTFEGMSKPTARDVNFENVSATRRFKVRDGHDLAVEENVSRSLAVSNDVVLQNMLRTGYPAANLRLVKGKVEDTLPGTIPDQVALLRLDTDWYESTYHELVHLYPRLAPGGVLIVDDYGHWQGARQAVDQYFAEHNICLLLHRVDYSCRIGVKLRD
jgi:hypothetical protein